MFHDALESRAVGIATDRLGSNVKYKSFSLWEMTEPGVLLLQRKTAAVDSESLAFSLLHRYLGHWIRGSPLPLESANAPALRVLLPSVRLPHQDKLCIRCGRDRWMPTKGRAGYKQHHHIKMFQKAPSCPASPWHRIPMLCGCLHHCRQCPSRSLMDAKAPRK